MDNINRWDPTREFVTLREAMNRLFEDSFVGQQYSSQQQRDGNGAELRLPIEAYATDHEIVVRAAVPGLKPEEVEITMEGDTLTLRGEFPRPIDNVHYLIAERGWGRFSRTLQLNVPVDADKAEALFENGLLTLTLPKAEAVRPRVIPIKAAK
jgi:HSP20 family protein